MPNVRELTFGEWQCLHWFARQLKSQQLGYSTEVQGRIRRKKLLGWPLEGSKEFFVEAPAIFVWGGATSEAFRVSRSKQTTPAFQ